MNINNTVLPTMFFYYPLGNTPPVSLTQDLPPEQSADILLLGCGDARNILFTCFVDKSRKIDVTCCDIEPGIHARNILLYTLLIDDEANRNIERIWNIYYCWKLDKNSLQLLETQTQKLLDMSKSVDEWHDSIYGSSIRFCNERSLSAVRCYWSGFSSSQTDQRQSQLLNSIHRAKVYREKMIGKKVGVDITGCRSVFPVQNFKAADDITRVCNQWWDCGTVLPSSDLALKPTELNPAFLFSPNKTLTLHYGLSPLHGVPLSTAYTPISKEHALYVENKGLSSTEHLINCVKSHFRQWASAFRRALANKSVLRIFAGDALAFCLTLRNCQLTQSISMNLFCHNWTTSPLILHDSDYVHKKNSAPLIFDIVDTSNLADHLGPLNMIALASCLLKHHAFNSLYTETLVQHDSDLADRLANFFGVDVRSMSLMFGLVPPDIFTNATNSVEEDLVVREILKSLGGLQSTTQARSRLRWKRVEGCQASSNSSYIQIEAKTLAKFLIQVHDAMFKHENPSLMFNFFGSNKRNISKQANPSYNRASFAFLLSILKDNVNSDWDECMRNLYDGIFDDNSTVSSVYSAAALDLELNLLVFGVHKARFPKPDPANLNDSILTSILPICKDIPDQLCVTVRVCRERFETIATKKPGEIGSPIVICSFEGRGTEQWQYVFSSVQLVFGKWREKTEIDDSYPFIEEDNAQLLGTSDMFASVMVPTSMLLQSKRFVPVVKCRFLPTVQNLLCLQELGPDLCFACSEMTNKDVFITKFMPGLSELPTFNFARNEEGKSSSDTTEANLSHDCSRIDSLVKRISLKSEAAKTKLAMKSSTVKVDFKSPLTAVVSIAGSLEFKLQFPIPVSDLNHRVRIARKSSYIEVECHLFNPLKEDAAFFLFPTFLMKASCDITLPVPWTSMRVNLDAMPPLVLKNKEAGFWLNIHFSQMFSVRERHIRNSKIENDIRTEIKEGFFSLFTSYTGVQGRQSDCFGLSKKDGGIQTLIFPSCMRLDLVNYTVVLDCAIIPLTETMMTSDRKAARFFQDIYRTGITQIKVSEDENRAWKALMPALVERCRTWKHASSCEYLQAFEVPLPKGLNEDGESPICSCGIGNFPKGDYLKDKRRWLPSLSHMLKRYGTRAAISPIFAVQYVEDCAPENVMRDLSNVSSAGTVEQNLGKCRKCGSCKRINAEGVQQSLLTCSGCKMVKYCSTNCQKGDWKSHKAFCKGMQGL